MDCIQCGDERYWKLFDAVKEHHDQKADDRCIEDDDKLYTVAGLSPCDRRVGDKFEMIKNCVRFVDRRCENGEWKTYKELEEECEELKKKVVWLERNLEDSSRVRWGEPYEQ